jgi:hypothetical protein
MNHFKSLGEIPRLFLFATIFLFLCEFNERIKGANDGQPKIHKHELFAGLMIS